MSNLELGLRGQGTLDLSLVLDGVSDTASEAAGAKDTVSPRSAALVYTVIGNTVTGAIDGKVVYEHYRKDGTVTLLEDRSPLMSIWAR